MKTAVKELSRKELKRVYKDLIVGRITSQVWWDTIEGQDKDVTMSIIKEVRLIEERLKSLRYYILTKPVVGKGCSYGAGSDSYPATIVEVSKDGKTIWVTDDSHKPTEDYDYYSNQSHTFKSNMDGARTCYTLRKNGRWINKGVKMNYYWCGISIGIRRYYQDPSF